MKLANIWLQKIGEDLAKQLSPTVVDAINLRGDIDKFEKFLKSLLNIHQTSPNVFLFRQTFSVFTLLSQYGGNDVSCSFFTVTSAFYHNAV